MFDDDDVAGPEQMLKLATAAGVFKESSIQGPKRNSIKYWNWTHCELKFGSSNQRYTHLFGFSKVMNVIVRLFSLSKGRVKKVEFSNFCPESHTTCYTS